MNLKQVFGFAIFLVFALFYSSAHISIDIEDSEDAEIAVNFIQRIGQNQQLVPLPPLPIRNNRCCSWLRQATCGVITLIGTTISMAAAGILLMYYPKLMETQDGQHHLSSPALHLPAAANSVSLRPNIKDLQANATVNSVSPRPNIQDVLFNATQKMCKLEFGCGGEPQQLCWRACYSDDPNLHLWCHTSPQPHLKKSHQCDGQNKCSKCWECIET